MVASHATTSSGFYSSWETVPQDLQLLTLYLSGRDACSVGDDYRDLLMIIERKQGFGISTRYITLDK